MFFANVILPSPAIPLILSYILIVVVAPNSFKDMDGKFSVVLAVVLAIIFLTAVAYPKGTRELIERLLN